MDAGKGTSMTDQPWWASVDPEVERLAKRIATRHGYPVDTMALPYMPLVIQTGGGEAACVISQNDMRPLWTFEINVARQALEMRDDQDVTDILQMGETPEPKVSPDKQWRLERGLDDEATV